MEKIELQAQKREIFGKKTSVLRDQGLIPAILYGHNFESLPIQVEEKNFSKAYGVAGESSLLYIRIGDQTYPTIIHDIAIDPVDGQVIHADFYKVRLDEKIEAKVPLVFIGESPAVKELAGILVKNINEVEIKAFPQDMPHNIEVDISRLLNFRDQILIKDLIASDKLEVKERPDEIVALIQEPISQEELEKQLEATTTTPEEVEVIKKAEKEGEAVEEGTTAEEPKEVSASAKSAKPAK